MQWWIRLGDKIDILDSNAVKASPVQQVYRTVSTILALVRVCALCYPHPQAHNGDPTRTKSVMGTQYNYPSTVSACARF